MKPITSRIKRSPLFSYGESPAKQTAKGGSTTKTDDKEIVEKKEVRTQASKDFEAKCYNADGSRKRGVSGCTWADEKGTEAPSETEIVETKKTIPGEEKDIEFDVMEMQREGTMLEPWEATRQARTQKSASRRRGSARRKMGKYGSFTTDESGKETFKANPNLSEKEKRRLQKAQDSYDVQSNIITNVKKGTKQGVKANQTFERGQRKVPLGKRTEDQQKSQAERRARIEANKLEDELSGKSSGQAGGAVEVGAVNPFAGIGNINVAPLTTPSVNYMDLLNSPGNMNKKGYKQKAKSPATKALKGAQNKLPQHLQDAIKAAPGKMKSPMKKGYFKGI
jgi:hypothetical protein